VLLRIGALAAALLALSACGGAKQAAAPSSTLPPGCTVPEVERVVRTFLTAPSVAPPGTFDVYATYESDKRRFVTHSGPRAVAHVRRRLALGERTRLIQLRVGKQDFNTARITFTLTRYAPDFARRGIHTRLVQGGGTVDCAHGEVAAWVTKGP
jgi:hypothetical protein